MSQLKTYRDRRDFRRSPEPRGGRGRRISSRPRFVIQKHDASRLHYDFRLEAEGVLKSWAAPRGPSLDPREKRLAVMTEDHPLDYADFEGTIPEGEYGGGVVIVWDAGTYENLSRDERGRKASISRAIERGKVEFRLWGKKLQGDWALIHMINTRKGNDWLLIKEKDEFSDRRRKPLNTQPESVLTGRTLKEVGRDSGGG